MKSWKNWEIWAVILVTASFVWIPLFFATFKPIAGSVNEIANNGVAQHIWDGILQAGLTNWLLVCIGFGQLWVFGRQADISDRQAGIAKKQTDLLERQTAFEEMRLFEDHRPRILVKDVSVSRTQAGLEIRIAIFNIGSSTANVGHIGVSMGLYSSDPPVGDSDHAHIGPFSLKQGWSVEKRVLLPNILESYRLLGDESQATVFGNVTYFGVSRGRRYLTGFKWEKRGRYPFFRRSDDQEDNYNY